MISPQYQSEQQRLHEGGLYGTASIIYAPMVSEIIQRMGITHLLDYGCGSQVNLAKHLKVPHKVTYQAYDPAVPRFEKAPLPAQMVACIDVMEHIEPEHLDSVLNDLARLAEGVIFMTIDTGPALKSLSDGRNAHLIQQPIGWWVPKLLSRWELQTLQATSEHSFLFIGLAKTKLEASDGTPLT